MCIMDDGTVLGWGSNTCGQLGLTGLNVKYEPEIVNVLNRYVCGFDVFCCIV